MHVAHPCPYPESLRTRLSGATRIRRGQHRARAQEELARWLVEQHRATEAEALFDAARATYTEIGATGWIAKLDVWLASRQSAPTQ